MLRINPLIAILEFSGLTLFCDAFILKGSGGGTNGKLEHAFHPTVAKTHHHDDDHQGVNILDPNGGGGGGRNKSSQQRTLIQRKHVVLDMTTSTNTEKKENKHRSSHESKQHESNTTPLSMTISELSKEMGGKGRAQAAWDCYRIGVDPMLYYDSNSNPEGDVEGESVWLPLASALVEHRKNQHDDDNDDDDDDDDDEGNAMLESILQNDKAKSKQTIQENWLPPRRSTEGLGRDALSELKRIMEKGDHHGKKRMGTVEECIARLSHVSISADGTTKLLLKMAKDGLEVETVIIPWSNRKRSTVCLSSQVGCRQGCTFCATGRMGKLRSLASDEILVQMYYATKLCRILSDHLLSNRYDDQPTFLYPIDNIVFMGMGEPADNSEHVVPAAQILTDHQGFSVARAKTTISTIAPSPQSFRELGVAPAVLAWSVHAVDDALRKRLVPTTKHTMIELRDGFVRVLRERPNKRMTMAMLEIVLIDRVNDSLDCAHDLVAFSKAILEGVGKDLKLVINLIPYNDIGDIGDIGGGGVVYKKPTRERVRAFQDYLTDRGLFAFIRTTRGDEESAACGQLATKKKRKKKREEMAVVSSGSS
mmetsp:Transcript_49434/g.73541  ORF Transcript_49434/g.73541 Transcript_49434/m.73541 type:complete len:593 (+) Transcript_49434:221-1999(+)|eukprot:CAMPEP_0195507676 /NCGR_PEP_ID=MMETSP0794_2-20130614/1076_1 /TAXON_ID=515487 /ORGANISM="Stephanopyxis turris, Strain CCMP 815" /LENGTH=592 /DNA_ID=CAMNT_0040634437 /DNA_START=221 /DNA_END=2002 /DNA_ORIENTATION=-